MRTASTLLGCILTLFSTSIANGSLPEPGPQNRGLRLRLSITTAREKDSDVHTIRIELLNEGKGPVILVGQWPYEENEGDYAEFLKSQVKFVTYPEVQPPSAQTEGSSRKSAQPQREIKPGESLAVTWTATGHRLKPERCFDVANTTPILATNGLYGVRASIVVITKDKRRVLLVSNEQQVSVGGSMELPKFATARVVWAHPDDRVVGIGLGSDQRIQTGDTFVVRWGLQASWGVRITKVGDWYAEGPVETIHREERDDVPLFPEQHWIATLEAKRKQAAAEAPTASAGPAPAIPASDSERGYPSKAEIEDTNRFLSMIYSQNEPSAVRRMVEERVKVGDSINKHRMFFSKATRASYNPWSGYFVFKYEQGGVQHEPGGQGYWVLTVEIDESLRVSRSSVGVATQ